MIAAGGGRQSMTGSITKDEYAELFEKLLDLGGLKATRAHQFA